MTASTAEELIAKLGTFRQGLLMMAQGFLDSSNSPKLPQYSRKGYAYARAGIVNALHRFDGHFGDLSKLASLARVGDGELLAALEPFLQFAAIIRDDGTLWPDDHPVCTHEGLTIPGITMRDFRRLLSAAQALQDGSVGRG